MKPTTLPSIPGIVDPMLIKGTFTRVQIMDEVRRLRPDFKDPSAAVSNGFRRQVAAGNHPAIVEIPRERKAPKAPGVKRTRMAAPITDRLAKLDEWATRMNDEIGMGFKRLAAYKLAQAKEPKLRRIWA
jgi:sirohydrochlorin ferrochelatase